MKISKLIIKNYRALHDLELNPKSLCALVGRNNVGKSCILNALQLFFKGSVKYATDECFHNYNKELPIEIIVHFDNLSKWELEYFKGWLSGTELIVGRSVQYDENEDLTLSTFSISKSPEQEWLQQGNINGNNINTWWQSDSLIVGEKNFKEYVGNVKPKVGEWKEHASRFVEEFNDIIPLIDQRFDNPKGYPGVLKGGLPEYIYVPAVRDITDETKIVKTNPFGQLIHAMISRMATDQRDCIEKKLKEIDVLLNRGTNERFEVVKEFEARLNSLMNELMECDIEIEMATPKVQEVFQGARIYASDGVRTGIERKGHGMQRSMIFSILRAYADMSKPDDIQDDDNSIKRSVIFAFEEPELFLHPLSQRTYMDTFRQITSERDQIFYSTHSDLFIDISHFDDVCVLKKIDNKSSTKQLSIQELIDDLKVRTGISSTDKSMRELYSHAFLQSSNNGFFADKVVIVEGATEEYFLPIIADIAGYNLDKNNIAIVSANGKGNIDRLLRIYNGFEIPTYIVFDGDKNSDDPNNISKTKEILGIFGAHLKDNNIKNLETSSSASYTVFEYDIEHILKSDIANYDQYIQEAAALMGKVGKPLKCKYVGSMIKKSIEQGAPVDEAVPNIFLNIIKNIQELEYQGPILLDKEYLGNKVGTA